MVLDRPACEQAIEERAREAGLPPLRFAEGILAISNAAMADAMRTITVSQGVDPRDFTLTAFGGAGPMAAAFLADELGIGNVLIPMFPGTFSAWGMLQTDLRQDFSHGFFQPALSVDVPSLETIYRELEAEGAESMAREGISKAGISYRRSADMRYVGQEYTITVPVSPPLKPEVMIRGFHASHHRRYGHSSPNAPVEFVNLRIATLGALARYRGHETQPPGAGEDSPLLEERQIVFDGVRQPTRIYFRDRLPEGFAAEGPVIVEEKSATTVVPPGWRIVLDEQGDLLLHRRDAQ